MIDKTLSRHWLFIIFLYGGIFTAGIAFAKDPKIFILHSYHQEYSWTHNQNEGFTNTLTSNFLGGNISFSTENLDTKRVTFNKEYQEFFFQYLKHKYSLYSPDVIFSTDVDALTFLLQFKERLFGDVPVIFCGVNNLDIAKDLIRQQYAGVFEKKEFIPNLNLLKKFDTLSGKIIFLGDNSPTYQSIKQEIENDIASQNPELNYSFLASDNHPDLIKQLELHKEGVIILTTIGGIKDAKNHVMPLKKITTSLVHAGNFAILSMEDAYMNEGILGGYVTNGFSQGKKAANLANQILTGDSPLQIPLVKESPNEFMFNYPDMKRLGVSISQIPEESIVLNMPESFYEQYKFRIWSIFIFLFFQSLAIVFLFKNIQKRKTAEKSLSITLEEQEQKIFARTSELSNTNADLKKEISERKEAQETAQRFNRVFEHSLNEIYIFDAKTLYFIKVNRSAQKNLGYTMEELSKLTSVDLKPEVSLEAFNEMIEPLRAGMQKNLVFSTTHQRKNGTLYPVEVHIQLMTIGAPVFVASILDIAERKRAEDEQTKLKTQLLQSQKMEAIGTLASGIAHEINTPAQYLGSNIDFLNEAFTDISSLMTYFEKLIEATKKQEVSEQLIITLENSMKEVDLPYLMEEIPQAINQSADGVKQISSIVLAMKNFAHPGGTQKEPTNLNELLKTTFTVSRNEWKYCVEPILKLDPDLPLVPCMRNEIGQVFLNIIVNAAHSIAEKLATNNEKEKGDLVITTKCEGNNAQITVTDSGCGISKENLTKIFDPFFTTKEVGRGTGQGLTIAYDIVTNKHEGAFEVTSEEGVGTTFTITLPGDPSLNN